MDEAESLSGPGSASGCAFDSGDDAGWGCLASSFCGAASSVDVWVAGFVGGCCVAGRGGFDGFVCRWVVFGRACWDAVDCV